MEVISVAESAVKNLYKDMVLYSLGNKLMIYNQDIDYYENASPYIKELLILASEAYLNSEDGTDFENIKTEYFGSFNYQDCCKLYLHYVNGYTFGEVGKILKLSAGWCKQKLRNKFLHELFGIQNKSAQLVLGEEFFNKIRNAAERIKVLYQKTELIEVEEFQGILSEKVYGKFSKVYTEKGIFTIKLVNLDFLDDLDEYSRNQVNSVCHYCGIPVETDAKMLTKYVKESKNTGNVDLLDGGSEISLVEIKGGKVVLHLPKDREGSNVLLNIKYDLCELGIVDY